MKIWKAATGIGGTVGLFAATIILSSGTPANACTPGIINLDQVTTSSDPIAGYTGDQLHNAAAIMNAATGMGLTAQAQTIGVMTAMGESSLHNLDHGDSAGPDSRGLFQQRDSWGTLQERLDPTTAATLFYTRLETVPGWRTMAPTAAAHAVQGNADPDHYTPYFAAAAAVVDGLTNRAGAGTCGSHAQGDDYPWPNQKTTQQGGGLSPLGYYYRECTDFVAWRLNRDVGGTTAPWRYRWSQLTPLGGDAIDWKKNWTSHGWGVSKDPTPGSVAYWGAKGGPQGHVAYVQAVDPSAGTITIEEYNWGGKHTYDVRTISSSVPDAYLAPPPQG